MSYDLVNICFLISILLEYDKCEVWTVLFWLHKLQKAMEEPSTQASSSSNADKELQETAYSIIILYWADNVLRQIDGEDTTYKVWIKLEQLYLTKSLANRILLKEKNFGFKMDTAKNDFEKIPIT